MKKVEVKPNTWSRVLKRNLGPMMFWTGASIVMYHIGGWWGVGFVIMVCGLITGRQ